MDLAMRLSPGFDLKSELLSGRVEVLTKTDCVVFRDSRTGKHTSRFYNFQPKQFVGNYKNPVFAQPVKDGRLGSFKGAYDLIEGLMEMGIVASFGDGLPQTWGNGLAVVIPRVETIRKSKSRNNLLNPRRTSPASSSD